MIDVLVVKSRQAAAVAKLSYDQELEELRPKLQALEDPSSNAWENIGDGG